jgi:hypothetical protein
MAGLILIFANSVDSASIGHTVTTLFTILVVFIIVGGPIALFKKFIWKRTRTVGRRPFVSGRDCRDCGGWGLIDGKPCTSCGGRRTR